ncbi:hypothetical protein ABW19_dt0209664 [Dactylella cylindrospora]|nr:hypothetical protein ABW19_dt0209664 [Dactylella cylindrospora]
MVVKCKGIERKNCFAVLPTPQAPVVGNKENKRPGRACRFNLFLLLFVRSCGGPFGGSGMKKKIKRAGKLPSIHFFFVLLACRCRRLFITMRMGMGGRCLSLPHTHTHAHPFPKCKGRFTGNINSLSDVGTVFASGGIKGSFPPSLYLYIFSFILFYLFISGSLI